MKFIISILALSIAIQSFAQDEKLSMEKCREMAVGYNQDVKSSIAELEASGYDAEAINKDNLPKIDLNTNYRYLSNGISMDGFNTLEHIYNVNLSIIQNIYSGSQVKTSYELARTKETISSEQKRYTASEVVLETDRLYWDVVGNAEFYNLSIRYRNIVDQLVITVLDKVEEEVLSKTEYLQAKVNLNDAELKVIQSENNLKLSEMALNRVIGIDITTDINTDDSISVDFNSIDDIDYVQTALSTRAEIKINENLVTASDLNVGLTRSPYLPTIGVGANGRYGTPGDNLGTEPNLNFQAFGYLNMPLVYFGKKGKQVEASRVRSEIASLQLDKTQDLITLEVSQARYALEESVKKVELTQNSVQQADENLDLVTDRYTEGLSPIIDVLNAQIFWESAYMDFVDAKKGFQVNYSIYQKALGLNYIDTEE